MRHGKRFLLKRIRKIIYQFVVLKTEYSAFWFSVVQSKASAVKVTKPGQKTVSKPAESSSSDDSDEPATKILQKPGQNVTKAQKPTTVQKTAQNATKAKKPIPGQNEDEESSSDDSSK